jgi:hypothetical protein
MIISIILVLFLSPSQVKLFYSHSQYSIRSFISQFLFSMHYYLLLLTVAVSIVNSSPANTITTSSRSAALVKRQANPFCELPNTSVCCTGSPQEDSSIRVRGAAGKFTVDGCQLLSGMYLFFQFLMIYLTNT